MNQFFAALGDRMRELSTSLAPNLFTAVTRTLPPPTVVYPLQLTLSLQARATAHAFPSPYGEPSPAPNRPEIKR